MVARDHFTSIYLTRQDFKKIWSKLKVQLDRKLEVHFPNLAPKDPYRIELENKLYHHLLRILISLSESLVVDGIDLGVNFNLTEKILKLKQNVHVEPFDKSIDQELRDLLVEVENTFTSVCSNRRNLPLQAMDAYEHLVSRADNELYDFMSDDDYEDEDDAKTRDTKEAKDEAKDASSKKENDEDEDMDLLELLETELDVDMDQNDLPNVDFLPDSDMTKNFSQAILNLAQVRKSLPAQEKKIRAYNEVIDFLTEIYENQQKELI